jgi:hypothetical protein
MPSQAFVQVLRAERDRLNAQFATFKRQYPELDAEAFKAFLHASAEPVVRATEIAQPDRVGDVVLAAYEIGLQLVGQRIAGPRARHTFVDAGWRRILPRIPGLLAKSPLRVMTSLSNALHNLATSPGARGEDWIIDLERLSPRLPDVESLLRVGQVCAWRAGLAHYRSGALAACDALPEPLALAALGASSDAPWKVVRERLLADPWFDPAGARRPRARWVGAFRGFGGLFPQPPRVFAAGEHLLVTSADQAWILCADAFGTTFHRATSDEAPPRTVRMESVKQLAVGSGRVGWRGRSFDADVAGEVTSVAADASTLAFTASLTHAVTLIPLGAE